MELIVVLVILGILIAMFLPALTGYIDKAHEKAALAECRQAVLAAQTVASETYAAGMPQPGELSTALRGKWGEIEELAEVDGTITELLISEGAQVGRLLYNQKGGYTVLYDVARSPVYSIVDMRGKNVVAYQMHASEILLGLNLDPSRYNNTTTQTVQKTFKEANGGAFPVVSAEEARIIGAEKTLYWKPVATKNGILMAAADEKTDKSNPMSGLIYYKGYYYYHTNGYGKFDTNYVSDNASSDQQKLIAELEAAPRSDKVETNVGGWIQYIPN